MKSFTLTPLYLMIFSVSAFSQVTQSWVNRFGTSYSDYPTNLVTDNSANVYIASFRGGPSGQGDIVTIKYNSAGTLQWSVVYNSPDNLQDIPNAMVRDGAGNIYVTGYSIGGGGYRALTVKYNASGALQWAVTYNTSGYFGSEGKAIAVDAAGNVYVAGGSVPSAYEDNYMVLKYNSGGILQWTALYNGTGDGMDVAKFIRVDASGNVYVTGESVGVVKRTLSTAMDIVTIKYNASGAQLWLRRFNTSANRNDVPNGLLVDGNGKATITGYTTNSADKLNMVTMQYDALGNATWTSMYAAYTTSVGTSIAFDPSGNYIVTGSRGNGVFGGSDLMVAKFSPAGSLLWTAAYNGGHNDGGQAVATDIYGNIYVTGTMTWYPKPNFGQNDYITVKFNASGAQQWAARYNGPGSGSDHANSIAIYNPPTAINNPTVYITGSSPATGTQNDIATIKYSQPSQVCCVIGATRSVLDEDMQPAKFRITNFPNPFSATTNIEYEIPEQSDVMISIYNAVGQEISTIYEGSRPAGTYRKLFSSQALASGVYHYKIIARSATKKYSATRQMAVK